ncbi:MAG: hypothetical protein HC804_00365 [Anaerolineae bacterium]|nr:hypothetical protein [Anaerolineae bacterium]
MKSSKDLALPKLRSDVHTALKHWHTVDEKSESVLAYLLLVQDRVPELGPQTPAAMRLATNRVLLAGLEQLEKQQPQAAHILKKRFHDQETMQSVSWQLDLSVDQVKHKQREALWLLAKILYALEMEVREAYITRQEGQLEARSYTQLFGVDALSERVYTLLTTTAAPWVITLVGIGGIGKTSLANHAVRQAIRQLVYEEVLWLKIANQPKKASPLIGPEQTFQHLISQLSQKLLPALPRETAVKERLRQLQQLFKSQAYLIVVDNLELEADTAYLLAELVTLAQPSRFLLTARTRPVDHAGSLSINLPELSQADSVALIRQYAAEIGFVQAAAAEEEELLPIYQVVGRKSVCLKTPRQPGKSAPPTCAVGFLKATAVGRWRRSLSLYLARNVAHPQPGCQSGVGHHAFGC